MRHLHSHLIGTSQQPRRLLGSSGTTDLDHLPSHPTSIRISAYPVSGEVSSLVLAGCRQLTQNVFATWSCLAQVFVDAVVFCSSSWWWSHHEQRFSAGCVRIACMRFGEAPKKRGIAAWLGMTAAPVFGPEYSGQSQNTLQFKRCRPQSTDCGDGGLVASVTDPMALLFASC
jgi:hypothetical protein